MTNEITIPAGEMDWETWCKHRDRMSFNDVMLITYRVNIATCSIPKNEELGGIPLSIDDPYVHPFHLSGQTEGYFPIRFHEKFIYTPINQNIEHYTIPYPRLVDDLLNRNEEVLRLRDENRELRVANESLLERESTDILTLPHKHGHIMAKLSMPKTVYDQHVTFHGRVDLSQKSSQIKQEAQALCEETGDYVILTAYVVEPAVTAKVVKFEEHE